MCFLRDSVWFCWFRAQYVQLMRWMLRGEVQLVVLRPWYHMTTGQLGQSLSSTEEWPAKNLYYIESRQAAFLSTLVVNIEEYFDCLLPFLHTPWPTTQTPISNELLRYFIPFHPACGMGSLGFMICWLIPSYMMLIPDFQLHKESQTVPVLPRKGTGLLIAWVCVPSPTRGRHPQKWKHVCEKQEHKAKWTALDNVG